MESPAVDPSPATPPIIGPNPLGLSLVNAAFFAAELSQEETVAVIGDPVDFQDFCRMPKGRIRRGVTPARRGKGARGWRRPLSFKKKDRLLFTGPPPSLPEGLDSEGNRTLILSNLQWWVDDCVLRDAGSSYGQVRAIKLLDHSWSGRSTGLALVEFSSSEACNRAIVDKGRAWARRQNERSVHVNACPDNILIRIAADGAGDDLYQAHWSQGGYISESTCAMIFELAGVSSQVFRGQARSQLPLNTGVADSSENPWIGEQFANLLKSLCEARETRMRQPRAQEASNDVQRTK